MKRAIRRTKKMGIHFNPAGVENLIGLVVMVLFIYVIISY